MQISFWACFYIIWVCWIRICRSTFYFWCHSPSNKQNKKWPPKPHLFYIFVTYYCTIFVFFHDLELIHLCSMFFDQNDLYLTFKFKMVTANTQIKPVFMHMNYNIINNICLMRNWKIDYVIQQIRLQGIRNCIYSQYILTIFDLLSI